MQSINRSNGSQGGFAHSITYAAIILQCQPPSAEVLPLLTCNKHAMLLTCKKHAMLLTCNKHAIFLPDLLPKEAEDLCKLLAELPPDVLVGHVVANPGLLDQVEKYCMNVLREHYGIEAAPEAVGMALSQPRSPSPAPPVQPPLNAHAPRSSMQPHPVQQDGLRSMLLQSVEGMIHDRLHLEQVMMKLGSCRDQQGFTEVNMVVDWVPTKGEVLGKKMLNH